MPSLIASSCCCLLLLLSWTASPVVSFAPRPATFPRSVAVPRVNNKVSSLPSPPTKTSLQMAPAAPAIAAITGAITGGLCAGGLHAIAGPDHLAALLPKCCGQRWFKAGRIGALWGMGHGFSATLLGVLAFGLKTGISQKLLPTTKILGHIAEAAVGISLVIIGVMGIKEAREWEHEEGAEYLHVQPKSLSAAAAPDDAPAPTQKAVIMNGLLHGFSWDGAPSLAPALCLSTWSGNLTFLASYAFGTMATMAIATTLIGEGTRRAGRLFRRPDIPQKLSFASSIVAVVVGSVWCGMAIV